MARTKVQVPTLDGVDNIKLWARKDLVISVHATECFQGYNLEFIVTKNKALIGSIALIGSFTVSINARNLESALEVGSQMFEGIMDLVSRGRQEVIRVNLSEEAKPIVGLAHIKAHRQVEKSPDKKMQTLMEVDFLTRTLSYKKAPLLTLAKMDNITISQMRSRVIVARGY